MALFDIFNCVLLNGEIEPASYNATGLPVIEFDCYWYMRLTLPSPRKTNAIAFTLKNGTERRLQTVFFILLWSTRGNTFYWRTVHFLPC